MKHLDQENKGLETQLTAAQNDLDDEKKTLDEKSTFLHFTQEQLNVEIENLTCAKEKMTMEIDNLKALLQTKEQELKSEKDKVKIYILNNSGPSPGGWGFGGFSPPIFDRSVNPISTRGG